MKKSKRHLRATQNKSDEKFAKKVICQICVSIFIFVATFVNSQLSNPVSGKINDGLKYYLSVGMDFEKLISTAKVYFENIMGGQESIPVNTVDTFDSEENSQ